MSKSSLLCVLNVLKTSFVRYECLKDVFSTLCMSVMDVLKMFLLSSKMSFAYYKCLKDVLCTLWMSQRCLLYIIWTSSSRSLLSARMSERRLWCVINILCYECIKDVFQTKRYGHHQKQRRGVPKKLIILILFFSSISIINL